MINGNEMSWLDNHEANMGRTRGLHEEQRVTQEQGIRTGFSLNQVQCNLAPSSTNAIMREVEAARKREKQILEERKARQEAQKHLDDLVKKLDQEKISGKEAIKRARNTTRTIMVGSK